jgi:hypothetical protein
MMTSCAPNEISSLDDEQLDLEFLKGIEQITDEEEVLDTEFLVPNSTKV